MSSNKTVATLSIALSTLAFGSCASTAILRNTASGQIGCPPNSIEISDQELSAWDGTGTWTATCHGKRFYCSKVRTDGGAGGLQGMQTSTSCKEAVKR